MATGPSTTTNPYLLASEPNVSFTSIATVGDVLDTKDDGTPYRMVGIPDGLGAFDNGDGTFTVLMNHELRADVGIVRDHGAKGAFVSQLVIDKSTLQVVSAQDAIQTLKLWNDATLSFQDATYAIGRLCSADLAATSAYSWTAADGTVYGTTDRIFLTGEENGTEGKEFGVVVTGAEAGTAYELAYTGLFSWENAVSSPFSQLKTINIGTDDTGGGQVYVYIGEKQTTGNAVEKAGLVGGDLYGIKVANLASSNNDETNANAGAGAFTLVKLGKDENGDGTPDGDVSAMTGVELNARSEAVGVAGWLRPEDVHFDPTNPNVFYFVTTNAFNNPSWLYRGTFTDIANPEVGGTIEAMLDGTEGQQMLDNITVTDEGKLILQEDPGNQTYLARVWLYDPVTETLIEQAEHDAALFTPGLPGFITRDEEASGVIDVTAILGDADTQVFLMTDQIHASANDAELVEKGQLTLMKIEAVRDGGNEDDTLNGDGLANAISGNNGDDTIRGGSGNDVLHGNNGDDTLIGMSENDTLYGDNGNDKLDGGAGNDTLVGGRGDDVLTGGTGADVFDFTRLSSSNGKGGGATGNDTITDFVRGEDHLVFSFGDSFKSQKQGDFNGDGIGDTRLSLSAGGTVTLLGVSKMHASDIFHASPVSMSGFDHDLSMMAHQLQIA